MRDLSLIAQSVTDATVKSLVDEAIRAFNGGAHRSATVSLWVAVAVDLTNKVRAIAEGGDGLAKKSVEKLDAAVEAHDVKNFLAFENGIIDLAEKRLELLDHQEAVHLRRLYEDRNLCAHPGFASESVLFAPTAEAVRAHVVAAYEATFSKGAVAGKRRQEMLIEEIQGEAWPRFSVMPAYLWSRFFEGAPASTKLNMMKLLIKAAIAPPDTADKPNVVAKRAREASAAQRERDPACFENAVGAVLSSWEDSRRLSNEALVRAVGAFGGCSEFWNAIPETALERARSYTSKADLDDLVHNRFFGSRTPLDVELSRTFKDALERLGRDQLASAMKQTRERALFVDAVLNLIGESESFASAAARMQLLADVSTHLTPTQVALLQQKIVDNEGDQIRPARDVEEALVAAFERACPVNAEVLKAWGALAATLVETTDSGRYYGNYSAAPYEEFRSLVDEQPTTQSSR